MVVNQAAPHTREHPHRRLIAAEIHARPVAQLEAPLTVRRLAFLGADIGGELAALHLRMVSIAGVAADGPTWARQLTFDLAGESITWELHNEFGTLTWTSGLDEGGPWPVGLDRAPFAALQLIAAARVDLVMGDQVPASTIAALSPLSLCHSSVLEDGAEAATDFREDAHGFTRFVVAVRRFGPLRQGVIARRLLEVETYRTMALLGLPVARELGGRVREYEANLAAIMRRIGDGDGVADHQATLAALQRLSVDIGRTVEETSFRFAAVRAYGEVLDERLKRLREQAVGEATTIERFLNNRVQPALATCEAMEKRLTALTLKTQRSIDLLDARISLSIQTQNQAVLDTISDTAKSQYRLQETVEGLSIIAISYYALALLSYVLEGLHDLLPLEKPQLVALAAPVVLLLVFLGVRRLRRNVAHRHRG